MHPSEFKERWELTNAELAELTGYSLDGVQHWLRKATPAKIPESVFALLDQFNLTFSRWETEEEQLPPHHREIFMMAYGRRQARKLEESKQTRKSKK